MDASASINNNVECSNDERIKRINLLIGLKKEADLQSLKIEGHLQELELEYQREVNGASIIRGLEGYLGIRSSSATPMANSRGRRPSALSAGLRDEDRIFTRAALLPSRHSQRDYLVATASSADDDLDRGGGATEEDELEDEPTEDDSDYEVNGGSHRRRQR